MTDTIGTLYGESDAQRVNGIEIDGESIEVSANRFDDIWGVGQELPEPRNIYDVDEFIDVYEGMLRKIEAMQKLGYTFDECDGAFAFWSKEVEEVK